MTAQQNPFKFGTPVDGSYFTDREKELRQILNQLNSPNHLILISPRRFGKISLVKKAAGLIDRPHLYVNVQMSATKGEFLSALLRELYRQYPLERIKDCIRNFRIIPKVTFNPLNGDFEFSFDRSDDTAVLLEDVFGLLEELGSPSCRTIAVFDEFQDFLLLEKGIDKKLRGIIQMQKNINYVFLGSEESMMTNIFMNVSSPFYRFGTILHLQKIPRDEFTDYLTQGFASVAGKSARRVAEAVLKLTDCHPHYTQQLASQIWSDLASGCVSSDEAPSQIVCNAADTLSMINDVPYDRLWGAFSGSEKLVLLTLCRGESLSEKRDMAQSTLYSALERLLRKGFVIKSPEYTLEDPVFCHWIRRRTSYRLSEAR